MDIMPIVIVSSVVFIAVLIVGKLVLFKLMAGSGAPRSPESVLEEVEAYLSSGKKDEAIHCLKAGLEVFAEHPGLLKALQDLSGSH